MKVIYEAVDGRHFSNEYDCYLYELSLKLPKEAIRFWDAYNNEVDIPQTEDEYTDVIAILWTGNEAEAKYFKEYIDDTGWESFRDVLDDGRNGLYVWDRDTELFVYQGEE